MQMDCKSDGHQLIVRLESDLFFGLDTDGRGRPYAVHFNEGLALDAIWGVILFMITRFGRSGMSHLKANSIFFPNKFDIILTYPQVNVKSISGP